MVGASWVAHLQSPASFDTHTDGLARVLRSALPCVPRDDIADGRGVERTRHAQCAWDRSPPLREVKAARITVQRSAAAWQTSTGIGDENALDRYDAQQLGDR